eukprot:UN00890
MGDGCVKLMVAANEKSSVKQANVGYCVSSIFFNMRHTTEICGLVDFKNDGCGCGCLMLVMVIILLFFILPIFVFIDIMNLFVSIALFPCGLVCHCADSSKGLCCAPTGCLRCNLHIQCCKGCVEVIIT